ncbi:low temperature requirement protein A [Caulobacter sp. DWR2-3-1b2]|uniref:low temperature requirement protein A n=1 Tax=unclassified Caulobacter TaxID=2648921 RepID=UPI003CE95223
MLHHLLGHADLKTAAALTGGPFLFMLGGLLFKKAVFRLWSPSRGARLVGLAALAPLSLSMSPLVLSVATTAVLAGVAAFESLAMRRRESLSHGKRVSDP